MVVADVRRSICESATVSRLDPLLFYDLTHSGGQSIESLCSTRYSSIICWSCCCSAACQLSEIFLRVRHTKRTRHWSIRALWLTLCSPPFTNHPPPKKNFSRVWLLYYNIEFTYASVITSCNNWIQHGDGQDLQLIMLIITSNRSHFLAVWRTRTWCVPIT